MNHRSKKSRVKSRGKSSVKVVGSARGNIIGRERIISALNDERFPVRTFSGMAKEFGVDRSDIVDVFKTDEDLLRKTKILRRRSLSGDYLITTKTRFSKTATFMDRFIDVFSTKRVDIEDV